MFKSLGFLLLVFISFICSANDVERGCIEMAKDAVFKFKDKGEYLAGVMKLRKGKKEEYPDNLFFDLQRHFKTLDKKVLFSKKVDRFLTQMKGSSDDIKKAIKMLRETNNDFYIECMKVLPYWRKKCEKYDEFSNEYKNCSQAAQEDYSQVMLTLDFYNSIFQIELIEQERIKNMLLKNLPN